LHRGSRLLAVLAPGEIKPVQLSRAIPAVAYSNGSYLFLSTSSRPHIRAAKHLRTRLEPLVPESIFHGNLFRFARNQGALSIDEEMRLSQHATAQTGELALAAVREVSSPLTIAYFSLIDELSHVYLDQIERQWPEGRASELLRRCFRLIDSFIGKIMDSLGDQTLLVLSADHGQAPYRRALHLNDLLAEAGLVRLSRDRSNPGYDLRHSVAYYHPSNCGQVVVNAKQADRAGLSRNEISEQVLRCVDRANDDLGVEIGHFRGGETDPFLVFLYPRSDTHLRGRYSYGGGTVNPGLKGGQHLSPLCPNPWIQAMLALWAPSGLSFEKTSIPDRNTGVKEFLLHYLY
jgi:hypothetical protein